MIGGIYPADTLGLYITHCLRTNEDPIPSHPTHRPPGPRVYTMALSRRRVNLTPGQPRVDFPKEECQDEL